ncbi:MAG: DUF167 family protein [Candidatus Thorarchaeota archaeon]
MLRQTDKGVLLRVHVRFNPRERRLVTELHDEVAIVNIHSLPEGGKANAELVKRLAKILGVSTSDVVIASGSRSREKIILVSGLRTDEVRASLERSLGE